MRPPVSQPLGLVEQPKSGISSVTVWGGLIAAIPGVAALVLPALGAPAGALDIVSQLTAALGGALAIYGRYTATQVVGKPK